jgi:hypothetical protein
MTIILTGMIILISAMVQGATSFGITVAGSVPKSKNHCAHACFFQSDHEHHHFGKVKDGASHKITFTDVCHGSFNNADRSVVAQIHK